MEVVRHLERLVPEDLSGDVLTDPDRREDQRLGDHYEEAEPEQRGRPADLGEEGEHDREWDQEEAEVACREADVVRVGRLDRVQSDGDEKREGQRPRDADRGSAIGADRGNRLREHTRSEHGVERHQEVDVLSPADADRDPERERGDERQGQDERPAKHQRRERPQDEPRRGDRRGERGGAVPQVR